MPSELAQCDKRQHFPFWPHARARFENCSVGDGFKWMKLMQYGVFFFFMMLIVYFSADLFPVLYFSFFFFFETTVYCYINKIIWWDWLRDWERACLSCCCILTATTVVTPCLKLLRPICFHICSLICFLICLFFFPHNLQCVLSPSVTVQQVKRTLQFIHILNKPWHNRLNYLHV